MDQVSALIERTADVLGITASELTIAVLVSVPLAAILGWLILPRLLPRTAKPFVKITPANTTFVVDLHEVLMHPNYWSMIRRIVLRKSGWRLLYQFFRPTNLGVILELARRPFGLVSEEVLLVMTRHPESRPLRDALVHIINDFTPDPQLIATLAELKRLGYNIVLFSNIGETCFESLSTNRPEMFASFSGYKYTMRAENFCKKPDPRAFQLFLQKFATRPDQQFILLDDKSKNIAAAAAASPQVRGTVYWSAFQFRRELEHWGVL